VKEKAIVVKVKEKEVIVRTIPDEKCSGCCSCGASEGRSFAMPISETIPFREGDILEIEVSPGNLMRVYLVIYAIPLLIFLAVLIASYKATASPVWSFVSACAALGAAYSVIGFLARKWHGMFPQACVRKEEG
jgi:positive regulator of sigma E activity